eukprot:704554-Pleurochrysis_carterae.AAC.2
MWRRCQPLRSLREPDPPLTPCRNHLARTKQEPIAARRHGERACALETAAPQPSPWPTCVATTRVSDAEDSCHTNT